MTENWEGQSSQGINTQHVLVAVTPADAERVAQDEVKPGDMLNFGLNFGAFQPMIGLIVSVESADRCTVLYREKLHQVQRGGGAGISEWHDAKIDDKLTFLDRLIEALGVGRAGSRLHHGPDTR